MNYLEIVVDYDSESFSDFLQVARKPEVRIEFPPDGELARRVISRSNAKATGKLPSWKMGRSLHYESTHERNAFKLFDACPDVLSIKEQPCIIRYIMNGESHVHYPDVLVELPNRKVLVEVKTSKDASKFAVRERTKFMEKALPYHGYSYQVLVAEQLAKLPRLHNIEKILKFGRRSPVTLVQREHIRQLLKSNGCIYWGALKPGTSGEKYRSPICRLILEGTLRIDYNSPLIDSSPIYSVADFTGGASC